jgi:hypothetical protein
LALAFALEDENAFENASDAFAAVVNTESYLAKLVDSMRATPDVHADALRAFRDLREAARLTRVSFSASNSEKKDVDGLRFVAAKASTSLLRLASRLPADAVFFRAGVSCRAAGDSNSAFVFLNRYLDIADSIDDAADASFDGTSPSPRASSGKTLRRVCEPWTTTTSARRTFPRPRVSPCPRRTPWTRSRARRRGTGC